MIGRTQDLYVFPQALQIYQRNILSDDSENTPMKKTSQAERSFLL
jgi:hypothetical protein